MFKINKDLKRSPIMLQATKKKFNKNRKMFPKQKKKDKNVKKREIKLFFNFQLRFKKNIYIHYRCCTS